MSAITVCVYQVSAGNNHEVQGNCYAALDSAETGDSFVFYCTWPYTATAAQINAAIMNAAIAEALSQFSNTVGALDAKVIIGGASIL